MKFGGSENVTTIGRGIVRLLSNMDGNKHVIYLHDVLHIPVLLRKLFSVSAPTKKGCSAEFHNDRCYIKNQEGVIKLVGTLKNGIYFADVEKYKSIEISSQEVFVGEEINSKIDLWHQRMGHLNPNYLIRTAKVVRGMEAIVNAKQYEDVQEEIIKCDSCCKGKLP